MMGRHQKCVAAWALTVGISLVPLSACRHDRTAPRPVAKRAAPSTAANTVVAPTAPSAPAPTPPAPGPAESTIRCKAVGRRGFVSVGTLREPPVDMVSREGAVFVLSFAQPLARATLTRFPRDGSASTRIGQYTGLGEPTGFVLGAQAAYFVQNKSIVRMGLDGTEPSVLAKGVARAVGIHGDDVYAVACDPKASADHLVRVRNGGGEPESVAELTRPAHGRCDVRTMAVDETTVFVGDYANRRVLSVSLQGGAVRELATKKAFVSGLHIEPDHVVFQAAAGFYRVPRSGGEVTRLTELGSAPFFLLAADPDDFWLYDSNGYTDVQWLYRLPRAGGSPIKVDSFREKGESMPNNIAIYWMAVDEQCVYLAQYLGDAYTILARQKPAPTKEQTDGAAPSG